jgi:isopenicillin-N epimerase
MKEIARHVGATWREAPVPFPVESSQQVLQTVVDALSPRTKLLIVDHVTSPTALIFPLKEIVVECAKRNIDVLIDGAHAPGMLDLDVEALGAAYYTGNLHKWVCAPKGAGFLWARPDKQRDIHPTVISHHLDQGLAKEFSWQGTRDISAWLCAADAVKAMGRIGWPRVREHNHALAVWARQMLCREWNVAPVCPESMLGSMATLALPGRLAQLSQEEGLRLNEKLYHDHAIEVPFVHFDGRLYLRIACQLYNRPEDFERLAGVVKQLM